MLEVKRTQFFMLFFFDTLDIFSLFGCETLEDRHRVSIINYKQQFLTERSQWKQMNQKSLNHFLSSCEQNIIFF